MLCYTILYYARSYLDAEDSAAAWQEALAAAGLAGAFAKSAAAPRGAAR